MQRTRSSEPIPGQKNKSATKEALMKKVFILILTLLLLGCCSCTKASEIPDFQVPEKKITPAVTPKSTPHATQTPHSEYNEWVESAQLDIYHGSYVDGFDKKSLQKLESASCIIVLATVVNKKQVDATPPDEKEYGLIHETTATTLKIEKIFKNTTDEALLKHLKAE